MGPRVLINGIWYELPRMVLSQSGSIGSLRWRQSEENVCVCRYWRIVGIQSTDCLIINAKEPSSGSVNHSSHGRDISLTHSEYFF
jgi:hypothetical protein